MQDRSSRLRAAARGTLLYAVIAAVTLAVFDIVLIAFDLFPPRYEIGDPQLGWVTVAPADLPYDRCTDMSAGVEIPFYRNEVGIRTRLSEDEIRATSENWVIAAVGDSQSDQCAKNHDTHQGVMEQNLKEAGIKVLVLSNGVGRYSPLQSYLLYKRRLKSFDPDVLVLNWYTGNDFIDILRLDDRPHFQKSEEGYRIVPPVWFRYYDPSVEYRSRVMYLTRSILDALGIRNLWQRIRILSSSSVSTKRNLSDIFRYLNDIRRSIEPDVGYSAAFSAQFLNQQLYMHHFPGSDDESLRRAAYLLRMIREENPDITLLLSPIPSYQLVGHKPVDPRLEQTLSRLPIGLEDGIKAEEHLYNELRVIAAEEGWLFADNLAPLREYSGPAPLYNDFDFHVTAAASKVIGATQADKLAPYLKNHETSRNRGMSSLQ